MARMTREEFEAYEAKCVQPFRDEESGKIPYEDISHTFPPYVPLPTEDGQVVAMLVPNAPTKKRRPSAKPTSS
jgi:hypothetical protein